jgi:hypothetical protein
MSAVVIPPGRIDRHSYRNWLKWLVSAAEFPALGNRKAPRKTTVKLYVDMEYER